MIGCCPSFRTTVAESPKKYFAYDAWATRSKDKPVVAVHAPVDDARRIVDVQPKALHAGVYGIRKRSKAYELPAQGRRELRLAHVDRIRQRDGDLVGNIAVRQFVYWRFRRNRAGCVIRFRCIRIWVEQRPRLVLQNILVGLREKGPALGLRAGAKRVELASCDE